MPPAQTQSPLMYLLGGILTEPEPEPEPQPEPKAGHGSPSAPAPTSTATKINVETKVLKTIALRPGERCEFAIAVRDGMTIDASARFVATAGNVSRSILPLQRSVALQGSCDVPAGGGAGSLEIVLDNSFSWLTNKLVVLSLTRSTVEQRRAVEEEHAQVLDAQTKRRTEEEAKRAAVADAEISQAQKYLRCEALVLVRALSFLSSLALPLVYRRRRRRRRGGRRVLS